MSILMRMRLIDLAIYHGAVRRTATMPPLPPPPLDPLTPDVNIQALETLTTRGSSLMLRHLASDRPQRRGLSANRRVGYWIPGKRGWVRRISPPSCSCRHDLVRAGTGREKVCVCVGVSVSVCLLCKPGRSSQLVNAEQLSLIYEWQQK